MENKSIQDKEVSWKLFGISVNGTITTPMDKEVHPAVVLVAGSGPTDRDWCSPILPGTNGSGKLLAETLANQGFVTMRYDKIASGSHARENVPKLIGKMSMQSHLEELRGAVETALAEQNVDTNNLFALTNSEGAIHAVNYQLQTKNNPFKGLVLTGAPGRTIGEVSRSQIFNQTKQLPNAEVTMKIYDSAIADFLANKQPPKDTELPEGSIRIVVMSLWNPANLPFSRELWNYSLPEHVAKIDAPMLIIIGKKDVQVDWEKDGKGLEKATAQKSQVSFVYPENANHVLKHEAKPREEINAQHATLSYNAPNAELDRDATEAVLNWLKNQISRQVAL
jgi:alpha-beta hydrolase superfamily lysophospholipase